MANLNTIKEVCDYTLPKIKTMIDEAATTGGEPVEIYKDSDGYIVIGGTDANGGDGDSSPLRIYQDDDGNYVLGGGHITNNKPVNERITTFEVLCDIPTLGDGESILIDTGITYAELKRHKKIWFCYKGASNTSLGNVYGGFNMSATQGWGSPHRFIRANGASYIIEVEFIDDYLIADGYMSGNPSIFPTPEEGAITASNSNGYGGWQKVFWKRMLTEVAEDETFGFVIPASSVVYRVILYAFD